MKVRWIVTQGVSWSDGRFDVVVIIWCIMMTCVPINFQESVEVIKSYDGQSVGEIAS